MRVRLGFALAVLFAVGLGGCASGGAPSPGPGAEIEESDLPVGEAPRENEFTEEANRFFSLAAEAEQDSAFAQARQQYRNALQAAVQGIEADPTNPLPFYQAGLAYLGVEDYVGADSMWVEAVDLHPRYGPQIERLREQNWVDRFNLGVQAVQAGNEDEAILYWEQADAIWDGRPEAMLNLGATYANRGELEAATDAFERALETIRDPEAREMVDSATIENWEQNEEIAIRNLARLYQQLDRHEAAAEMYRTVLAEEPQNVEALSSLAQLMVEQERPDSARAIFDQLMEAPTMTGADYFRVGIGYYQMDAYEDAADAFGAAAEAHPYNRDALQNLAQSLLQRIVVAQNAETAEDSLTQAEVEALARRMGEAADRLMEIDPKNPVGYELKAQSLVRLGESNRAAQVLEGGDNLDFNVTGASVRGSVNGGGAVSGTIVNHSLQPGTEIRLRVTLYHAGDPLGSREVTVQAPAQGESVPFEVAVTGEEPATGFSYEVLAP